MGRRGAPEPFTEFRGLLLTPCSSAVNVGFIPGQVCRRARGGFRRPRREGIGRPQGSWSSGVLDDDPLDQVGHVLALVDRVLEQGVDVLPLEDVDRLGAVVEQARDG